MDIKSVMDTKTGYNTVYGGAVVQGAIGLMEVWEGELGRGVLDILAGGLVGLTLYIKRNEKSWDTTPILVPADMVLIANAGVQSFPNPVLRPDVQQWRNYTRWLIVGTTIQSQMLS